MDVSRLTMPSMLLVWVYHRMPLAPHMAPHIMTPSPPATTPPVRIAVVEDDGDTRHRFVQALRHHPRFCLVGEAANFREAQALLHRVPVDAFLVDLGLPDGSGIDLVREIALVQPEAEVLVISVFADEDRIVGSLEAGAKGYILKGGNEDIATHLDDIMAGGAPISPSIARQLLARFWDKPPLAAQARPAPLHPVPLPPPQELLNLTLTPREHEVLRGIARGYTYREIAQRLHLSVHSVNSHLKQVYRKLDVRSRGQAVFAAQRLGLLGVSGTSPTSSP
jgi:DNA-binding NarL/FixJ family response regulator